MPLSPAALCQTCDVTLLLNLIAYCFQYARVSSMGTQPNWLRGMAAGLMNASAIGIYSRVA